MRGIRWVALGLALFAIGLGVSVEVRVRSLESKLIPKLIEGQHMQTLTTTWRSKSTTQTVTTPPISGETQAAQAKRHNDMVAIQLAAWPADNT